MRRSSSKAQFSLPSGSKRWIVISGAVLFLWGIWISGVFGNSGVLQAYRLSKVRREISLRITALENEKRRLHDLLHLLEKDSFTQEASVRESLGWVRDQELVFEFR